MADAPDSKSGVVHSTCGFDPHFRHHLNPRKQRIYGLIFSVCQKCAMDALQNRNRTGLRLDAPVLVVFAK